MDMLHKQQQTQIHAKFHLLAASPAKLVGLSSKVSSQVSVVLHAYAWLGIMFGKTQ